MKSVRVKVELDEIQNGDRVCPDSCPVAKAFAKLGFEVLVTKDYICIIEKYYSGWFSFQRAKFYYTPPLIAEWIGTYDHFGSSHVLPIDFEFNLDNPYSIKELANVTNS